jgi:hypothetical protein
VVAELQRRFPGALSYESRTSAALHFTAAGFGHEFGDAELARLTPLRDQLVVVDVARTGVTDKSAAVLAGFAKLRVLRAGSTQLGDEAVKALARLKHLESLSLAETQLTAASIASLTKLRSLRTLRLAGTAAELPAQAANLPVILSSAGEGASALTASPR